MLNALEELRKIRTATHTSTATGTTRTATAKDSGEWNQAAADVLDIVARAGQPVPHPQIVKAMARPEYPKKEAYAAIAYCQERGWIEHNLVSGYVLSGMAEIERAEREDLA